MFASPLKVASKVLTAETVTCKVPAGDAGYKRKLSSNLSLAIRVIVAKPAAAARICTRAVCKPAETPKACSAREVAAKSKPRKFSTS